MKLASPIVLLALISVSPAVLAEGSIGYLDVFAVPEARLESSGGVPTVKGDGFGLKGAFTFAERYFASGEYQDVDYDDVVGDFDGDDEADRIGSSFKQYRLGLGLRQPISSQTLVFGQGEYISAKSKADVTLSNGGDTVSGSGSVDDDGYGVHLGLRGETGGLGVTAQIGYLDISNVDGPEYEIEADYRVWEFVGLFVNYRWSDLGNDEFDSELKDFRVGATIYFGS